ncbi:MAG TPA: hypothetical protein VFY29_20955 [Terriglobia bacterium]|nr:hypothetical protein [Terriglobia bacterium]
MSNSIVEGARFEFEISADRSDVGYTLVYKGELSDAGTLNVAVYDILAPPAHDPLFTLVFHRDSKGKSK